MGPVPEMGLTDLQQEQGARGFFPPLAGMPFGPPAVGRRSPWSVQQEWVPAVEVVAIPRGKAFREGSCCWQQVPGRESVSSHIASCSEWPHSCHTMMETACPRFLC